MIVREIKQDPDKILSNFDWFNDYADTRAWCTQMFPEIVYRLDAGMDEFLDQRAAEFRKSRRK